MSDGWIFLGWLVVIGLPSAVLAGAILMPQRVSKDRTVQAIRRRIEDEDGPRGLS